MPQVQWGVRPSDDGWEGWLTIPMPESINLVCQARGASRGGALARAVMGARDTCEMAQTCGFFGLDEIVPGIVNAVSHIVESITDAVAPHATQPQPLRRQESRRTRRHLRHHIRSSGLPRSVRRLAQRIVDELPVGEAHALGAGYYDQAYGSQFSDYNASAQPGAGVAAFCDPSTGQCYDAYGNPVGIMTPTYDPSAMYAAPPGMPTPTPGFGAPAYQDPATGVIYDAYGNVVPSGAYGPARADVDPGVAIPISRVVVAPPMAAPPPSSARTYDDGARRAPRPASPPPMQPRAPGGGRVVVAPPAR